MRKVKISVPQSLPALGEVLEPNDYIRQIHLKDAYAVIPIHPRPRKFLSFDDEGINIGELRAIFIALQHHAPKLEVSVIKTFLDNKTALEHTANSGKTTLIL